MTPFTDGTLLRDQQTLRVYVFTAGALHFIGSDALLFTFGYPQRTLTSASPAVIASLPMGDDATVSEGTLLRDQQTLKVYVFSGGALHFVSSDAVLFTLGYPQRELLYVPHASILALPVGADATAGPQHVAGAAIARLNDTAPLFAASRSSFAGAIDETLGSAGTPADGFDAMIAVPLSTFNADLAALSDLDAALALMDFVDGLFDATVHSPIAFALDDFTVAGQGLLGGFDALLG